jgi:hypothetical protein
MVESTLALKSIYSNLGINITTEQLRYVGQRGHTSESIYSNLGINITTEQLRYVGQRGHTSDDPELVNVATGLPLALTRMFTPPRRNKYLC